MSTIKSIKLINFKKHEQLNISCRGNNILVGPNNAGKSSILDALRLCNDVLRHAERRKPTFVSHEGHGVCATYFLDLGSLSITISNVVRDYGDDDAEIYVTHFNGNKLVIRLHPDRPVTAFVVANSPAAKTTVFIKKALPLHIVVVPTLGPLEEIERFVQDETVRRNETTRLAHRNFRNIWLRKTDEDFAEFAKMVSDAWPGIKLTKPKRVGTLDPYTEMFFAESRREREVFWSGFGFQVWMQMMTHFMRGNPESILVLDEPDIYLHPDLQHRLVRIARQKFGQIFIATHSTEIINEANTGEIILVSEEHKNARRISSDDGYRDVFTHIGSSENVEFARMARARRILFFEGKDRKILRKFSQKFGLETLEDPDTVFLQTGGAGQWRRVKEVGWTLGSVFGMDVKIASIFDRDYFCDEEVSEFTEKLKEENIKCFVLGRKEIENYCLELEPLIRAMISRVADRGGVITESECGDMIAKTAESFREQVQSQIVARQLPYRKKRRPGLNDATVIAECLGSFEAAWKDRKKKLMMVPGKEFLSVLSARLQERHGTSLTTSQIIGEMRQSEVPEELKVILRSIESFFRG